MEVSKGIEPLFSSEYIRQYKVRKKQYEDELVATGRDNPPQKEPKKKMRHIDEEWVV